MTDEEQKVQADCVRAIEEEANKSEMDVVSLVEYYRKKFTTMPVLRLVQDINERAGVYSNLLEEIKRGSALSPPGLANFEATPLRLKYEQLHLIPTEILPHSLASEFVDHALKKLKNLGRGLINIIAKYSAELASEIYGTGVTIMFETEISLSPKVSIGIERKA